VAKFQYFGTILSYHEIKSRRMMRWAAHVALIRAIRNAYNILVGKPERKEPFGRPRHRWGDNIRTDLKEIWWEGVDLMHLA
jgi:hypothetical protein